MTKVKLRVYILTQGKIFKRYMAEFIKKFEESRAQPLKTYIYFVMIGE